MNEDDTNGPSKLKVQHKTHHDSRPYEVANKEAADRAKQRLFAAFEEGKANLLNTLQLIEDYVPSDYLVGHSKMEFAAATSTDAEGKTKAEAIEVIFPSEEYEDLDFKVHPHALTQLYDRANIPKLYADRLYREDPSLLVTNLRERYKKQEGKNYLARVVKGQLLGWLSDSFARYDAGPMLEAFMMECKRYGALPVEAKHLETRVRVKMIMPRIYEPIPNEVLAFGAEFADSDYGDGALDARLFVRRTWCTNDASSEEMLWKVHLGPKLTAENFSKETLDKQQDLLKSMLKDTVRNVFDPVQIEARLKFIQEADARFIPIKDTLDGMRRCNRLTKLEMERLQDILTVSDVELLPPVRVLPPSGETTAYRLANAFGLYAHDESVDGHRAIELEHLAGELMGINRPKLKLPKPEGWDNDDS